MTKEKTIITIVTVIVLAGLVLFGKSANAEMSVVRIDGIGRYVVIEPIPGGHKTYSYKMEYASLKLEEIVVTYKNMLMSQDDYDEYVKAEIGRKAALLNAQQKVEAARRKAERKPVDNPSGW